MVGLLPACWEEEALGLFAVLELMVAVGSVLTPAEDVAGGATGAGSQGNVAR